jgi:hypothetical protein
MSHPTASEIVRAVAQWLEEARPQLDQRNAYLARVASNALAIVERELNLAAGAEAALAPPLAALLDCEGGADHNYAALTRTLCERLRSGDMGFETPGLLSFLREDTLARLAIDQPGYRHERQKQVP